MAKGAPGVEEALQAPAGRNTTSFKACISCSSINRLQRMRAMAEHRRHRGCSLHIGQEVHEVVVGVVLASGNSGCRHRGWLQQVAPVPTHAVGKHDKIAVRTPDLIGLHSKQAEVVATGVEVCGPQVTCEASSSIKTCCRPTLRTPPSVSGPLWAHMPPGARTL